MTSVFEVSSRRKIKLNRAHIGKRGVSEDVPPHQSADTEAFENCVARIVKKKMVWTV